MSIRFPNLSRSYLVGVSVCGYIGSTVTSAVDAIRDLQPIKTETASNVNGLRQNVGLTVEIDEDGDVHVHAAITRGDIFEHPKVDEQVGEIGAWQNAVQRLSGVPLEMILSGFYSIPWKDTPEGGLVRGISDISTEVGGVKLSLKGAEIAIKGSPHYKRITWSKVQDSLRGEVSARMEAVISDAYLEDAIKLLDNGIRRFILDEDDSLAR